MSEVQHDASRLMAVDVATELGSAADRAVLAMSLRRGQDPLSESGRQALDVLGNWLEAMASSIEDPLGAAIRSSRADTYLGSESFSDLTGAALDALSTKGNPGGVLVAVRELQARVAEVLAGTADSQVVEALSRAFEQVAKAMLVSADTMLGSSARYEWTMTSAS